MEEEFEAMYPAELYTKRPNRRALLSPLYDWTFKQIFTQETEESNLALKSFISAVLNRKVSTVKVKNNEPPKETGKQKNMTFDVSVEFDDGEVSDIELQSWKQNYDYGMRAEILVSRLLNNNAKRGTNWKAPKVYQISVLNFHYQKSDKAAIKWYTMQDNQGNKLTDRLNVIFIDLETIRKKYGLPEEQLTPVEKWGLFLCYVDHEDKAGFVSDIIKNEEGIMAARKIVKDMSKTDNNWYIQNSIWIAKRDAATHKANTLAKAKADAMAEGRAEGLAEGLAEGKHEMAVETARKMLAKKMPLEDISDFTGLSVMELNKLAKK